MSIAPTTEGPSFGSGWRTRLSARLALAFCIPAVAIASIAASVAFVEARDALRSSAFERLQAATAIRERQFDRWVERQKDDLQFLQTLPTVREAASALQRGQRDKLTDSLNALLVRAVHQRRALTSLSMLSGVGGQIIASSDSSMLGDFHVSERFFLEGRTQLVVQNVYPSPTSGRPTLTIALPITGQDGRLVGVLAGDANLAQVDEVISERTGLGATGESYLVDRFHEFVRGTRYGEARFPRGVHTATIDAAVSGASGQGIYRNYAGEEVIGVYRWMPNHQLAIFTEMHTREAFAPARRLAWVIFGTGLLGAVALALGLTLVARRIARPVREIADAAQAVANGDFSATAPVRTRDEIGRLALSFNAMTRRLRTLYEELESQLRATREAARTAEDGWRLLRAVIDHLPAFVVVKDLQGRYLMVNALFATLHELDPASAVGRSAGEVIAADAAREVDALDASMLSSGTSVTNEETHVIHGEQRVYLVSRFPLRDDEQQLFAIGAVSTDITERKRLETQLLHQQKLEAVGRLAGGVAHDMNNLLTAVRCNAELLLDSLALEDPNRQHLEEIDRSVRNGAALTRQLLTFSRAHVVRASAVDVNRVLGGMAAMLRRYVGTGIDMQFALADDLWLVHVDEGQMEQVLLNLLSNAHDAMPGGGTATIETANERLVAGAPGQPGVPPGDYVRLSVRDDGVGIEDAALPLLFEPFFTTKDPGHGTGLGLSTAYAIVQQARGAITVSTRLGAGTSFNVFLPRHVEDDATLMAPVAQLPVPRPATSHTLLVVDDEPAVRVSVRRILARQGYRIIEAESGQDAIAQFEAHGDSIALVLTDIFMPGMGGHQLAAKLLEARPQLPIVFMSGYTADEVVRRGLMSAETRFLQKPFERQLLLQTVEDLLAASPEPQIAVV